MNIKGAIFDLDGTLLDSMILWGNIGADYLISRGIEPRDSIRDDLKKKTLVEAARYYQSEYGITDSVEDIIRGINHMIENSYVDELPLKEGVTELLDNLYKKGVKMCVATACDRHLVEAALKRNGVLHYFKNIFTCSEIGYGKENPLIYNLSLDYLKTNKEETYVFEDSLYAIKSAKSAKFPIVAIYDELSNDEEEEIREVADIYLKSFRDWGCAI